MPKYGDSETNLFIKRLKKYYPDLVKEKKMSQAETDLFFSEYLGLSRKAWLNFYNIGIKKIYYVILDLLEENQNLKNKLKK